MTRLVGARALGAVAAIFAVALSTPSQSQAGVKTSRQAFVKVNQFYLLYTYPVIPYLDDKGILMVGLDGIVRALSYYDANNLHSTAYSKLEPSTASPSEYGGYGQIKANGVARSETLALGGHRLVFSADSAVVQMDGRAVLMAAAAQWDRASHRMIIPIASLAHCLELGTHWDAQRRVFSISSKYLTGGGWGDYGGYLQQPTVLARLDTASLAPKRVTLHLGGMPSHTALSDGAAHLPRKPWVMIEMTNVSDTTINFEELNVAVLFSRDGTSPNLDGGAYEGRFQRGPDGITIPPGGIDRLAVALPPPRAADNLTPLCVVACPVSSASPSGF